jgi:hypothetical protein
MLQTAREYAVERLERQAERDPAMRWMAKYVVTPAEEAPAAEVLTAPRVLV